VDWWTYANVFLKRRAPGVYVDLAAHTYFQNSDTYFFDRCLGWGGLCIEADDAAVTNLRACVTSRLLLSPQFLLQRVRGERVRGWEKESRSHGSRLRLDGLSLSLYLSLSLTARMSGVVGLLPSNRFRSCDVVDACDWASMRGGTVAPQCRLATLLATRNISHVSLLVAAAGEAAGGKQGEGAVGLGTGESTPPNSHPTHCCGRSSTLPLSLRLTAECVGECSAANAGLGKSAGGCGGGR